MMTDRRSVLPGALAALLVGGPLLVPHLPAKGTRPGPDLADPDSRFDRFAGVNVHHKAAGPRDAPGILLSHHFYGSVATWRHVMEDLATDHRVVAFDRPGFGLTERPPRRRWRGTNPYTRETAARIGWELLDHHGIDQAVLIGSSAGGNSVLEMYARRPERVRGLALMSPAITGDVGVPPPLRPLLRTPQARRIGPLLARRFAGDITRERVSGSWHDPARATEQDVEPYQRMLQVEGWDRGFWEVMTAEPPPDLRGVLRSIDVPTVVIAGASDRVISEDANAGTASAIAGARSVVLPDCGHTPHEECPDQLLPALRDFLARIGH